MRKHSGNITNRFGVAIEGASVTVTSAPTGALAVLFKDSARTPKTNPIITDADGFFEFYVDNGEYSYTVRGLGIETYTVASIIFDDLVNIGPGSIDPSVSSALIALLDAAETTRDTFIAMDVAVDQLETDRTAMQAVSTALDGRLNTAETKLNVLAASTGAANVGFVPPGGGGLAATTVQGAVAELDAEKMRIDALAAAGGAALIGFGATTVNAILANLPVHVAFYSATYDPASLATGAADTHTATITGSLLGDTVMCSFDQPLQGINLYAWVSAVDTVTFRYQNNTGGTIDLASGILKARVARLP